MAQCGLPRMEGNEGVPLRFPRPSMAPVAVGLVAVWVALTSAPALADQVRQSEWWLRELHITTAQQISQGSGVTIAVLDTGVDAPAPDLAGSVLTGPDFSHSGRTANGPFFGIHATEIPSTTAGHGDGSRQRITGIAAARKALPRGPCCSHEPYVKLTAGGAGVTAETPSGYTTISSTSAASAVVAGVAALIKSAFPALTPAQVTKSLISSARFGRPDGRQIGSGYGTVDAARALHAAAAMAEPHGQRAYAGAVARVAPVTPLVRATQQGLRLRLDRDPIISLPLPPLPP